MKWRNSKERELLSTGGSRDSTLPNKGNQNIDLSDVGDVASMSNDTHSDSAARDSTTSFPSLPEVDRADDRSHDLEMDFSQHHEHSSDSEDEIDVSWVHKMT